MADDRHRDRDLAALRREYSIGGLSESDLAPEPIAMFRRWLHDVTVAGLHEPNAMVVSTATPDGVPSNRIVLLKGLDDRGFVFFTNYASRKGAELDANPAVALLFPWHDLERQVRDPALRAALTPDYAFGCKRVLLSDEFYPAVASDAVTLVPEALTAVEGSTLVAADGSRHEVDALVLATGFASTRQPYAELVAGERGRTLAEHWSGGMTAFASTVVAGFPNLFVLNGPNASLGHSSSVLMIEEQAAYVARVLDALAGGVLRVDPDAERAYTDEIARAAASTRWITGGGRNWYVDDRSGRLTLLWPGTVDAFRDRLARADGSEFLPAPAPLAH